MSAATIDLFSFRTNGSLEFDLDRLRMKLQKYKKRPSYFYYDVVIVLATQDEQKKTCDAMPIKTRWALHIVNTGGRRQTIVK